MPEMRGEIMVRIPKANEVYKHFKGNLYQVMTVAEHSETGEELVIYQALYGEGKVYARPLADFCAVLDKGKYPDAAQEHRFELQEPEEMTLDPMVLEFLDADNCEDRLNILSALKHRITDAMINTMAVACDVEVPEGRIEDRYYSLKNCLLTKKKFEGSRLR